jgi:hypothetical protein
MANLAFFVSFPVPPSKFQDNTSNYTTIIYFQILPYSLIANHPTISIWSPCIVGTTEQDLEESGSDISMYCKGQKPLQSGQPVSPAEIPTKHLPNTNPDRYLYTCLVVAASNSVAKRITQTVRDRFLRTLYANRA